MSENPYQTPQVAESGFLPPDEIEGSPEDIRRHHINHEASIKTIGFLYYLSAVFCALAGFFMPVGGRALGVDLLIGAAVIALGILHFSLASESASWPRGAGWVESSSA